MDNQLTFIPMGDPAIAMYFPDRTVYGPKLVEDFISQFSDSASPEDLQALAHILSTFERLDMERFFELSQKIETLMWVDGRVNLDDAVRDG